MRCVNNVSICVVVVVVVFIIQYKNATFLFARPLFGCKALSILLYVFVLQEKKINKIAMSCRIGRWCLPKLKYKDTINVSSSVMCLDVIGMKSTYISIYIVAWLLSSSWHLFDRKYCVSFVSSGERSHATLLCKGLESITICLATIYVCIIEFTSLLEEALVRYYYKCGKQNATLTMQQQRYLFADIKHNNNTMTKTITRANSISLCACRIHSGSTIYIIFCLQISGIDCQHHHDNTKIQIQQQQQQKEENCFLVFLFSFLAISFLLFSFVILIIIAIIESLIWFGVANTLKVVCVFCSLIFICIYL